MERLSSIPNWFYDFIVFVTPTAILAGGIVLGFAESIPSSTVADFDLSAGRLIGLLLLALLLSYEYGRAAEVWSAALVLKPLIWLQEKFGWESGIGPPDANQLPLQEKLPADIAKNRWTFYFYAYRVEPDIGSDLIKRYAWEKLSRSSALSYVLLFLASSVFGFVALFSASISLPHSVWGFGSWLFSVSCAALGVITAMEYRRRSFWNNDLLRKVAPVLASLDLEPGDA